MDKINKITKSNIRKFMVEPVTTQESVQILEVTVIHGTQIEQTDAYQAYRKMKVYGGALTGGAFFGYSAKRAQAFEIRNMQQAGFTRQKLSQIMQDQHILSKTMAESLNKGLERSEHQGNDEWKQTEQFLSKYRIDIDKLSDAQLSAFISILKNSIAVKS